MILLLEPLTQNDDKHGLFEKLLCYVSRLGQ